MEEAGRMAGSSYLRKLFFFNHCGGVVVGALFALAARLILGPEATSLTFLAACLIAGFLLGAATYLFMRATLKKQLRQQFLQLQRLTGAVGTAAGSASIESLEASVDRTVEEIRALLHSLSSTVDNFVPHYQTLADASRYLSARTEDGLMAAQNARSDVEVMHRKQQQVMGETELLSSRAQDEAAISRELSASLEAMAGALEHSTQKFLETTRGVDEVVDAIRQATSEVGQVARSMETTAHDLDGINEALDSLRQAVAASADQAGGVRSDAEHGLQVMETFIEEMQRIDQESQKAVAAMQRLTLQTAEVAKILEVIKDLVSDTELLAFNAAIIAAKAGAEGRGFSVVAEEIRDLADRTTASAGEIEAIVKSIREDTGQVGATVESTGRFIGRGTELSRHTGDALRKILASSTRAAEESNQLADNTGAHGQQVRSLVEDAGRSLRSVRAIAQAMQRQEEAVGRIQAGVGEMKAAADQVARGFDEQVRANREFDRSLLAREDQVRAIFEATRYQMETATRILEHFSRSEQRLGGNAEKARVITKEITELEGLARQLHELAARSQGEKA
jgi:methyl-accepting chemotaxis protein